MEAGDVPNSTSCEEESSQNENTLLSEKADQTDAKGDHTDARGLSLFSRNKKKDEIIMPTKKDAEEYNMKHSSRGYAIIFNHKIFAQRLNLNERRGTDVDREKLYETFLTLGFEKDKILVFDDLPVAKITQTLSKIAEEDHSANDCIVVAVCSHGDEGLLYGNDGKYRSEALWEPFTADRCPSLAGKPKLFFIQACRGDRLDQGLMMTEVDSNKYYKIPTYADFLIMYSTVPGYYSWRNTVSGSWFIRTLCHVLSSYFHERHLMDILTIVNHSVAYNNESFDPYQPSLTGMKQIPSIVSMLTRFFSWRNTIQGSWFIQALCCVICQQNVNRDLMDLLTRVNLKVAFEYLSCVPYNKEMDQKKQIPCITSMLTRKVYFTPKNQGEDIVEKD